MPELQIADAANVDAEAAANGSRVKSRDDVDLPIAIRKAPSFARAQPKLRLVVHAGVGARFVVACVVENGVLEEIDEMRLERTEETANGRIAGGEIALELAVRMDVDA